MSEIKGIIQQRMPYNIADAGNGTKTCKRRDYPLYAGNWYHKDRDHVYGSGTIKSKYAKIGVKTPGYKPEAPYHTGGDDSSKGNLTDQYFGYSDHIFKKNYLTGNHFYVRNKYAWHGTGVGLDAPILNNNFQMLENNATNISGNLWTPKASLQVALQGATCRDGPPRDLMCTACSSVNPELCNLHTDISNNCIGYNHGASSMSHQDMQDHTPGKNTDNDDYCKTGYKEIESQHGKERADAWCMAGGIAEFAEEKYKYYNPENQEEQNSYNPTLSILDRKCLLDSGDKEWECLNADGSEGDTPSQRLVGHENTWNKTCKQLGNEYRADAGMFYAKILCDKLPQCKSKRNHVLCNKEGGISAAADTNKDSQCENDFDELKQNNHYKTLEEEEEACRSIDGCAPYRSSFNAIGNVRHGSTSHMSKGCGRVIAGLESEPNRSTEGTVKWNYNATKNLGTGDGLYNANDPGTIFYERYTNNSHCKLTFDGPRTFNDDEKASEFYDYYKHKNENLLKAKVTEVSNTSFEKHNDLAPYYGSGGKGAKAMLKGGKVECKYNLEDFNEIDRIKEFKRKFPTSQGCKLDGGEINISCTNGGSTGSPSDDRCKKYIECLGTTDGNLLKEDDSNKCYVSEDERSCVDKNNQPASKCHLYPDTSIFGEFSNLYEYRDRYDDEEIKRNTENFDKIMSKYCGKEKHDGKFCINGASKCSRFLESNTQGGPLNDVGHFCHQWQKDINKPECHDETGTPRENSRLNRLYKSRGVNVSDHDDITNAIASTQNDRIGYCDKPENADAKECFCSRPEHDPLWEKIDDVYKNQTNSRNRGCWYTNCDETQSGKNTGNWVPPIPGIQDVNHEVHCPAICAITQNAEINIDGDANLSSADRSAIDAFNNKLSATCNMSSDGVTSTHSTQENSNPVTNPGSGGGSVTGNVNVTNNEEEESFIEKYKVLIGASGAFSFFVIFAIIFLLAYYYM